MGTGTWSEHARKSAVEVVVNTVNTPRTLDLSFFFIFELKVQSDHWSTKEVPSGSSF